jgi:hypothetical protein
VGGLPKCLAGCGQLGQAAFDVGQVLLDQRGDVLAWGLAAVAQGEDGADLREGEAGALGVVDEGESGAGVRGLVAVAAARAGRVGQQAGLVEAEGLGGQAAGGGEFPDAHTFKAMP